MQRAILTQLYRSVYLILPALHYLWMIANNILFLPSGILMAVLWQIVLRTVSWLLMLRKATRVNTGVRPQTMWLWYHPEGLHWESLPVRGISMCYCHLMPNVVLLIHLLVAPTFVKQPQSQSVDYGAALTLTCAVPAYSHSTIQVSITSDLDWSSSVWDVGLNVN